MNVTTLILGLIAFVVIIFVLFGLKIIQQYETKVVERLGRFHKTLPSGINIIWHILDKPRKIYSRYVYENMSGERTVITKISDHTTAQSQGHTTCKTLAGHTLIKASGERKPVQKTRGSTLATLGSGGEKIQKQYHTQNTYEDKGITVQMIAET